jgi:hypothetical protein
MNRNYKIGLTAREGGGYWHPYEVDFSWGVGGALQAYDLPDLIGCIAPRKVTLSGIRDQMLLQASDELVNTELSFPRSAYSLKKATENLKVISSTGNQSVLIDWSFK